MPPPDTDSWLVKLVSPHLYEACVLNIHPNVVTLIALVLSAAIPLLHTQAKYPLVALFIFLRQVCDLLDGPIARECKKASKLGGLLDTLADHVFIGALLFVILYSVYGTTPYTIAASVAFPILVLVITSFTYTPQALYDHAKFKTTTNLHSLVANNSILVSVLIIAIYTGLVYARW